MTASMTRNSSPADEQEPGAVRCGTNSICFEQEGFIASAPFAAEDFWQEKCRKAAMFETASSHGVNEQHVGCRLY